MNVDGDKIQSKDLKYDKTSLGVPKARIDANGIQNSHLASTQSANNICDDSFQKLYSKELDIDEGL